VNTVTSAENDETTGTKGASASSSSSSGATSAGKTKKDEVKTPRDLFIYFGVCCDNVLAQLLKPNTRQFAICCVTLALTAFYYFLYEAMCCFLFTFYITRNRVLRVYKGSTLEQYAVRYVGEKMKIRTPSKPKSDGNVESSKNDANESGGALDKMIAQSNAAIEAEIAAELGTKNSATTGSAGEADTSDHVSVSEAMASMRKEWSFRALNTKLRQRFHDATDAETSWIEALGRILLATLLLKLLVQLPYTCNQSVVAWGEAVWKNYKYDYLLPYCRNTFAEEFALLSPAFEWKKAVTRYFLSGLGFSLLTYLVLDYGPEFGRQNRIYELQSQITKIRQLSHEEVDKLCCVCMENPKSVLLIPCNHVCICQACLTELRRPACPICNSRVQRYLDKVFT